MLFLIRLLLLPLLVLSACGSSRSADSTAPPSALAPAVSGDIHDAECEDNGYRRDGVRVCETRTFAVRGRTLTLDASPNGGIEVASWDRGEIEVVAHVEAWGEREAIARRVLRETAVDVRGSSVATRLPDENRRGNVREAGSSVRYEVRVPREAALDLRTVNGGITIADVEGTLRLQSVNGALDLDRVGGEIDGRTTNGAVTVRLTDARLDRLDMETTNGPVTLVVPDGVSADVDARTSLGPVHIQGLPLEEEGCNESKGSPVPCLNGRVLGTLGQGGAAVRLRTTNGPIELQRR